MNVTFLGKMISVGRASSLKMQAVAQNAIQIRNFSVAYNIKNKFEDAYNKKIEAQRKVAPKIP